MQAIYPISALQKNAAAVRRDASEDIVRLTVDGRGMYVFATEEVFENYVQRQVDEALYEREAMRVLDRAVADEREGRLVPAEESVDRVRGIRAERGDGADARAEAQEGAESHRDAC